MISIYTCIYTYIHIQACIFDRSNHRSIDLYKVQWPARRCVSFASVDPRCPRSPLRLNSWVSTVKTWSRPYDPMMEGHESDL